MVLKFVTMKSFYAIITLFLSILTADLQAKNCVACTPTGDQTTYGTNNTWIGYAYQGRTFTTYAGYVTEGSPASPNFDESFGGDNVSYATSGCPITTENFAMRYKLTRNFTNANYQITVGGDDGYRLSLDGGTTWIINNWNDHSYTTTTITVALNGSTNMVLEYYENGGGNRVTFSLTQICTGTEDQTVYGTGNIWKGYIYQGMNFDLYKGTMAEGSAGGPNFDENFTNSGNNNTTVFNTSACPVTTYQFSARYRLKKTFTNAKYIFTIGGDDGYRLSLDGGATWVINKWNDQSFAVASYTAILNGSYDMVLEYYDNGGASRINFSVASSTLPVTLLSFDVNAVTEDQTKLTWKATNAVNFDHYVIQRSTDGQTFKDVHTTPFSEGTDGLTRDYSYTDVYAYNGELYYRLMMVDIDGRTDYSRIISLKLHNTRNIKIYPTIVDNDVFVETNASLAGVHFELYDMGGNRIRSQEWAILNGRQQVNIKSRGNLSAGAYIARLTDGHTILAKQMILVR